MRIGSICPVCGAPIHSAFDHTTDEIANVIRNLPCPMDDWPVNEAFDRWPLSPEKTKKLAEAVSDALLRDADAD